MKKQEVDSITIAGTLLNDDLPVDLTGAAVRIDILNPNKQIFSQNCDLISPTDGTFSVLLDEAAYSVLGEHQAQFRYIIGTEIDVTDKFYFESVDALPFT